MLRIKVRGDCSEDSCDFYGGLKKEYVGTVEEIEVVDCKNTPSSRVFPAFSAIAPVVISILSNKEVTDVICLAMQEVISKIFKRNENGITVNAQVGGVTISGTVRSPEELEAYMRVLQKGVVV
ncbi:MAG: hypothetical protein FWG55_05715 [Candidatus Bathyarchaeota archaeon]|nr:hypothetical protein [Candidatus Termiticorpusculum sp.]